MKYINKILRLFGFKKREPLTATFKTVNIKRGLSDYIEEVKKP